MKAEIAKQLIGLIRKSADMVNDIVSRKDIDSLDAWDEYLKMLEEHHLKAIEAYQKASVRGREPFEADR